MALVSLAGAEPVRPPAPPVSRPTPETACLRGLARLSGALRPSGGLDFVLHQADGSNLLVRLAGLVLPEPAQAREALQDALTTGLPATLDVYQAAPADRWNRIPILVRAGGTLVNADLLRRGLALARPGDVASGCLQALLAAEDQGRRAGFGAAMAAVDRSALLAREGRFTLVEGRVAGIGETGSRVYLNFGTVRSEDFAVVIQKRNLRKFEASGMRWTSLEGRRVRVRGTVARAGGPFVEASAPEDLERLD